jgi:hypothetical protein
LGAELKDVLLVPRAALDFSSMAQTAGSAGKPGGPRALLASGGAVPVKLGECGALECVVLSGLAEGTPLRSRTESDGRNGRRG